MPAPPGRSLEVFARFLRLGLSSFGGPVAHLGYFRRELVERAGWLSDAQFSEIVALCSVLPGPTSSQVGISLGALRAGPAGAFLAWLAFTTPSAIILTIFGLAVRSGGHAAGGGSVAAAGALSGLAAAAAAVVLLAVVSMARSLAVTLPARLIACAAFILSLLAYRTVPQLQWIPLVFGGIAGALFIRASAALPAEELLVRVPRAVGAGAFVVLVFGLVALPIAARFSPSIALFSTFFRAGSLVFGGGHVVLPFLEGLVRNGAVAAPSFFAGYGAAQVVPGPLFTFAAFLGAVQNVEPNGVPGALLAVLGIFAPSFLLLAAAIALWSALRNLPRASAVLAGINASVVGLLAAVFVDPVARTILTSPAAIAIAVIGYAGLTLAKLPAWLVVLAAAGVGAAGAAAGLRFS